MKLKTGKWMAALASVSLLATVTACGSTSGSSSNAAGGSPQPQNNTSGSSGAKHEWKIALSNSYIGNSWRSEMVKIFQSYAAQKKADGEISSYFVSSSGNDPQAQINEIRNMISQGYNAILVDAASPTALKPILDQAAARGIAVVAFDNTVDSTKIYNVNTDQLQFGKIQAQWLADQMHGQGNILEINGVEGTTVDRDRQQGYQDVLSKYPGIHVLQKGYGKWDEAATSVLMNNMLSAQQGKTINGILSQGGGEVATYKALNQNHIDPSKVYMTGEFTNGFFRLMSKDNVKGFAVGQPPYLSAASLDVALEVLNGKQVSKSVMIPLPQGSYKDASKFYVSSQPDDFFVDWTDAKNTYNLKLNDILPGNK